MMLTAPELLVPSMFGMEDSVPKPEAGIHAFGLVIFQVDLEYRPMLYILCPGPHG